MGGAVQRIPDRLQYQVQILEHQIIPESNHPEALRVQPVGAAIIFLGLLSLLSAIQLQDQPVLEADEIGDEWTDLSLSTESASIELTMAQVIPKVLLRFGHVLSKVPGELAAHPSPRTPTLPHKGGGRKKAPV